ncbi:MAG TPA: nucleoside monophosphate kinase [Candidatus Nanoarchaeia archaeon]|nr:nucleoside monophosphate kinase [Candidatus Nanoarchaeia archaeon]
MKLIILGIQGSGKGTQGKLAAEKFNLNHLSTGDIIRQEIQAATPLGLKFRQYAEQGLLVPDSMINEVIKAHLPKNHYLLDGYPRNIPQAEFLEKLTSPEKMIYLDLPEQEVIHRLSSRFQCKSCSIDYGLNHMPKKQWFCDNCKKPLEKRKDDNEASIKTRIKAFNKETLPLLRFYNKKVLRINADQPVEAVAKDISSALAN